MRVLGPSPAYDPNQHEAMNVVMEGLAELGMETEVETVPDFPGFADVASSHEYDIAAAGYIGTQLRLEPTELLDGPLSCAGVEAGTNFSGYCREEYEELLGTAISSSDDDERHEAVDAMQELLAQDLPMVVKYYPTSATVHNSEQVPEALFSPASGHFHFLNFVTADPQDGTLTIGVTNRGQSMNPLCTAEASDYESEFRLLNFDSLTHIDETGAVIDWAASEIEHPDETTVLVTLRDGMRFHDGSPVTNEDVAFTYREVKRWKVGQYLTSMSNVRSIEAVGDNQVEFKLKEPAGAIEFKLLSQVGILPKAIWENVTERESVKTPCDWEDYSRVGSGPYKMVSYDPTQALQLERNDDYWRPGAAEKIIGRYYSSPQSMFLDIRAGNTDFTESDPGFTPSQVSEAESDDFLTLTSEPSITDRYFSFNMREGEMFQDFALRKAVAQVIDYDTIVSGILNGQGVPGKGIISPANELWHNEAVTFPEFDIGAARQTLADAGYGWDDDGRLHLPANHDPQQFGD